MRNTKNELMALIELGDLNDQIDERINALKTLITHYSIILETETNETMLERARAKLDAFNIALNMFNTLGEEK